MKDYPSHPMPWLLLFVFGFIIIMMYRNAHPPMGHQFNDWVEEQKRLDEKKSVGSKIVIKEPIDKFEDSPSLKKAIKEAKPGEMADVVIYISHSKIIEIVSKVGKIIEYTSMDIIRAKMPLSKLNEITALPEVDYIIWDVPNVPRPVSKPSPLDKSATQNIRVTVDLSHSGIKDSRVGLVARLEDVTYEDSGETKVFGEARTDKFSSSEHMQLMFNIAIDPRTRYNVRINVYTDKKDYITQERFQFWGSMIPKNPKGENEVIINLLPRSLREIPQTDNEGSPKW